MSKIKILSSILIIIVFTVSSVNTKEVLARQDSYEYYKAARFAVSMDDMCLYWIEECTPFIGSQCAQPGGAFRTCVATLKLPEIPWPTLK